MVDSTQPAEKPKRGRKPLETITDSQMRTLNAIRRFIDNHGFPPTAIELGTVLGITYASAHDQVNQLVRKGYLKREPGKSRGISIVKEPVKELIGLTGLPVLGNVAAGSPILAEEHIIGEIVVESSLVASGRFFALQVQGDSMINAGISDGSIVIVRQQPISESGDIVVVLIGSEATVKRLYIRDAQIELRPENPCYQPIIIDPDMDLRIVGKVVAVRNR
ncbi:MAG: transcriptional repressor LexA [Armatimonadota bacterium]